MTSLEEKVELIAGLGVEELVVVPFDAEFAHQEASEFIDAVLVGKLGATHVSVGENFRFGHGAKGDVALLQSDYASRPVWWRWYRWTAPTCPPRGSAR